ncbi:Calcium-binding protein 7, partial [Eschrichtius robustus]|nr:Calcium-binding protein 7 [Eschrichtius robustus]
MVAQGAQVQPHQLTGTVPALGDGQVDFEEFVTLLGPKLSTSGIPEKFHGTDFDTVFWKRAMGFPGEAGVGRGLREWSEWLPALQNLEACRWLCGCRCWVGTVVVLVARALCLPQPKCDMQKLTVDELKRLLYDTFCEHLSMKDIENIIMTEEESHLGTAEECPVDVEKVQAAPESIAWLSPSLSGAPRRRAATACSNQQIRQTCVRKSLICAFAIAFIISVMLIAANQVLRSGMK